MKQIEGGVCAPKGFQAAGIHCGLRKKPVNDIAMIVSDVMADAAAVFTTNRTKGAPIVVSSANLQKSGGKAQAILCNSGSANTCVENGVETAEAMCALVERALKIPAENVLISSTGVIGKPLPLDTIENGMGGLVAALGYDNSREAAEGILTTDMALKEISLSFTIGGKECHMGAIAKGSGMIHPNMATMLVFATTDVSISHEMLQRALAEDVKDTFNMVSVDGDTSTNDMVAILANGMAENTRITAEGEDFDAFRTALRAVTAPMCKAIAKDGEGATKLITCEVTGGRDTETARIIAKTIVCSTLVKAAIFGMDANWGRVMCAIGYAGADVDVARVDIAFSSGAGYSDVCRNGAGIVFSEDLMKQILSQDEITLHVNLNAGGGFATAWGCDLTYDYVKISGNYRSR